MPYLFLAIIIALIAYYLLNRGTGDKTTQSSPDSSIIQLFEKSRSFEQAMRDNEDQSMHCMMFLASLDSLSIDAIVSNMKSHQEAFDTISVLENNKFHRKLVFSKHQNGPSLNIEIIKNPAFNNAEAPEDLYQSKQYWPDLESEIKEYPVAIFAYGENMLSPAEQAIYLSYFIQAVCSTKRDHGGAIWNGRHAISPQALAKGFQISKESVPIGYWIISESYTNDSGKVCGYTSGLADFDEVEFEAVAAKENPEELYQRLEGLAVYVLTSCATIYNGDTTGQDMLERITLNKRPSELGRPGWVNQMRYISQSPDRPWKR